MSRRLSFSVGDDDLIVSGLRNAGVAQPDGGSIDVFFTFDKLDRAVQDVFGVLAIDCDADIGWFDDTIEFDF